MPTYTAFVTILAVLLYFYTGTRVPVARKRYGVMLPAITGNVDFERVFRAHMNTLEWMPIFLPLLWLTAYYFSDRIAALTGLVWIAGRIAYVVGYARSVPARGPGFFVQSLACGALLILALIGIVPRLLGG
jgi:glutathione S-transferase